MANGVGSKHLLTVGCGRRHQQACSANGAQFFSGHLSGLRRRRQHPGLQSSESAGLLHVLAARIMTAKHSGGRYAVSHMVAATAKCWRAWVIRKAVCAAEGMLALSCESSTA